MKKKQKTGSEPKWFKWSKKDVWLDTVFTKKTGVHSLGKNFTIKRIALHDSVNNRHRDISKELKDNQLENSLKSLL